MPEYKALFRQIIQELQLCRFGYEDYIASLFNDMLLLVSRQQHEKPKVAGSMQEQIEVAAAYFNENYNTKISIDAYAESLHVSTNWFIHNFRQYMGMSPAQYVLSLRMVNAQSLLEHTNYNVKEISEIVGYDNPLYFSRVFKRNRPIPCAIPQAARGTGRRISKTRLLTGNPVGRWALCKDTNATARYKSCTGRLLYDEIAENGRKLQLVDGGVAVNGTVALHTVTAEPVGKIQPLVQLVRLQSG